MNKNFHILKLWYFQKILNEYEEKLSLWERDKKIVKDLKELRNNFSIEKLDKIIKNLDYSEEV